MPVARRMGTQEAAPGDLIRASVEAGARGIVLATAAGGTSGTQADGVRHAIERRVVVVRTTRTGSGRVVPGRIGLSGASAGQSGEGSAAPRAGDALQPEPRLFEGMIAGEDLTPIKARILLMLALARTNDAREIQRMFSEY